jgi:D-alanyl-lipoteichoic acid acyltransferase DltB (MBOAT superfamily)
LLFNSYPFLLVFLPVTLFGFFALARASRRLAAAWLTLASLVFYGWWNPAYVALLIASIAFNYEMGIRIARAREAGQPKARSILTLAVTVDLLVLGYYKYANFFVDNLSLIADIHYDFARIVLPLGVSFYTFTQIAFLVDAYRGKAIESNPVHYALFVTYFPHLIAGPILHHAEMMPQFRRASIYFARAEHFSVGLSIFAIGLFKKTVLADGIAPYASPLFATAGSAPPSFIDAWGGALAYTCQLYFDFSGYSDMAIGISRLFGIQLPINFDSPYKATNIIEFWRRWHMTLSRFLRDYVYFPLGGNRQGPARRYVNLFATMLIGGLWHGAGWTFVAWGALHGLYLIVNHAWRALPRAKARNPGAYGTVGRLTAQSVTFLAVVCGWVLFRAPDFSTALSILRGMLGQNGIVVPAAVQLHLPEVASILDAIGVEFRLGGGSELARMTTWIAFSLAIVFFAPNTQQIMARFRPGLGSENVPASPWVAWKPSISWAVACAIVGGCGVLSLHRVSEFLYYQF